MKLKIFNRIFIITISFVIVGFLSLYLYPKTGNGMGYGGIGRRLQFIENRFYDIGLKHVEKLPVSEKIFLVPINGDSIKILGRWPWQRKYHAQLLSILKRSGVQGAFFDIGFVNPTDNEQDTLMSKSLSSFSDIFLSAFLKITDKGDMISLPLDKFLANAKAVSPFIKIDQDGEIRRISMNSISIKNKDNIEPACLASYLYISRNKISGFKNYTTTCPFMIIHKKDSSILEIPLDQFSNILLRPIESGFLSIPYHKILEEKFSSDTISGKFAVIYNSVDPHEIFKSPFGKISGGEIHALGINTLLEGENHGYLKPVSEIASWLTGCLLLFLTFLFTAKLSANKKFFMIIVLNLSYILFSWILFTRMLIIFPFFSTLLPSWIFLLISFLFENILTKKLLSSFIPEKFADTLILSPQYLNKGLVGYDATALFCDICNYTGISETLSPEKLSKFVEIFHQSMSEIIISHGGTICDYQGDAILAVFGAPHKDNQHEFHAVKSARKMLSGLSQLHDSWKKEEMPAPGIGIGIASGEIACGFLGHSDKKQYTAIGDTVNLASRLQGLTRTLNHTIIISSNMKSKLPPEIITHHYENLEIKGKSSLQSAYGID